MPSTVIWINLKTSKLALACYSLGYASLLTFLLLQKQPLTWVLAGAVLVQATIAVIYNFGTLAPKAILLTPKQLGWPAKIQLQLKNQSWLNLEAPCNKSRGSLLVHTRFFLVFKRRRSWPSLPWLLWPDSISAKEHRQLRHFIASWQLDF